MSSKTDVRIRAEPTETKGPDADRRKRMRPFFTTTWRSVRHRHGGARLDSSPARKSMLKIAGGATGRDQQSNTYRPKDAVSFLTKAWWWPGSSHPSADVFADTGNAMADTGSVRSSQKGKDKRGRTLLVVLAAQLFPAYASEQRPKSDHTASARLG